MWQGSPHKTLAGSEDNVIVRLKFSMPSDILSSIIEIASEILVNPAGNVTVYGPQP